ncbi:hypothetical protein WOLCODRAFT_160448 [Wolfiporia cocos MD-104 SS10]|uniref:Uncharacterized protein n=1 Tax=Wolfiporia cocos (strain MD-104) TaxID=742152 RepID=A0A2H3IV87_WOLCO|nr:hypothetical protein WOLCODRAFT_160448 [Wolfiporia cocos MD-104 SS10]
MVRLSEREGPAREGEGECECVASVRGLRMGACASGEDVEAESDCRRAPSSGPPPAKSTSCPSAMAVSATVAPQRCLRV